MEEIEQMEVELKRAGAQVIYQRAQRIVRELTVRYPDLFVVQAAVAAGKKKKVSTRAAFAHVAQLPRPRKARKARKGRKRAKRPALAAAPKSKKRGGISEEGRKAISEAQRARWALKKGAASGSSKT